MGIALWMVAGLFGIIWLAVLILSIAAWISGPQVPNVTDEEIPCDQVPQGPPALWKLILVVPLSIILAPAMLILTVVIGAPLVLIEVAWSMFGGVHHDFSEADPEHVSPDHPV